MRKYKKVYLSLGTNIGEREFNLLNAIFEIDKLENTFVTKVSKLYETDPVGYLNQAQFLNLAIEIKSKLIPYKLLEKINEIENDLGRVRELRWGPRLIDIDIIFYENLKINTAKLIIPHKEYKNRNFVLYPLLDILENRNRVLPYLKKAIGNIYKYNGSSSILISSCLLGINTKYNAKNNYSYIIDKLIPLFNFVPACSEQMGGLTTPRKKVEILNDEVITEDRINCTNQFNLGANETLKICKKFNIKYAILKSKSPSCGYGKIYDGSFSGNLIDGNGITSELLKNNNIKIISI